MKNMLRLLIFAGIVPCGIVVVALGFVQHEENLMAPVNLVLFVAGILFYLFPMGLAIYRDCKATLAISLLNVFLGWTVIGWFAALGWAVAGAVCKADHPLSAPPAHPVAGH